MKVGTGDWQAASGTESWSAEVTLSEGSNKISARAVDEAGNVKETSVEVTLVIQDTTPPAITITSPSNGDIFNNPAITVTGTASDNIALKVVEVKVGTGDWQAASGTESWSAEVTLSEGKNTIYVRATDTAGNYDEISITVTFDTTPPSIIINDGAEYTNSTIVTLNLSSTMTLMKFSNDNTNWTDWEPFKSSRSWTLTTGDGVKTVFFSVSDDEINYQNRGAFDSIKLDTTPPAVSDISVTPTIQEQYQPVEIKAKISDNILLNTSSLSVLIEPQNANTIKCSMVSSGNGIYSCFFKDTSFYGRYNVKIIAFDLAGNTNNTVKTWFVTTMEPYNNISVQAEKNIVTEINALTKANTTLEFVTSQNVNGNIKITLSNDIPPEINQSINHIPFNKFISISANPTINYNLQWMNIKLFYTDNELSASGLDENSLRIIYYNESLKMWETLSNTGVNTANTNNYSGFVWANVSQPSTFAIVGNYPLPSNPQGPSSGGGGGGGGGGTSGENFANIMVKEKYDLYIYKDIVTSFQFTNLNNPVMSINIVGNVNAGEINTAVEVLRNTSSLVKSPAPGNVYKNVNIWVGTSGFGTSKNIKQAVIKFRIENSWISNNSIGSSSIKMLRWDGSKWNQLETSEMTKDSTYTYFEAKTDRFSSFAITGIEKEGYIPENVIITESAKPDATIQPGEENEEEKSSDFLINWFIIIGVFIAIGLIVEMYQRMRKSQGK
ncbi:MAG: PGF-pre-PGF domain-containing protein [Candidatus Methanoperedens sp.]|nr:PGF-pre-PGF domain-containing protein [Candidatus Methanoperedens sp.]